MVSMDNGLRHEHMVPRLDLLGRNINSIVGNLWQRQEEQGSGSSNGNLSPGSGGSGPGSPDRRGADDRDERDRSRDEEGREEGSRPSIGIRSDLLPLFPRDGGMTDLTGGLPALDALRRQANQQHAFLLNQHAGLGTPHASLSLTTKRPSQPPTPQSSSSGGDPSSAWSFEEQFKQLYEIDENPKRKDFLDDLFAFMQKRGSPINRLPIMAKQVLDLYELYNLVVARGGLVEVINKKQWQEIIKGLGLPSSITSAAFTLRTQYTKYLYPLEMHQHKFSNNADLQGAIDGNKREGRRLAPYDMPLGGQQHESPLGPHHRLPHSPTQSPPHPHADQLAQLEMTRLALWKLYSQGQAPPPPPQLMSLPPLDLDLRRREHERAAEEQMRAEEERRREEARRRITGGDDEPAEKRIRVAHEEPEEEEMEEEEEAELEVTRKPRAETTIQLSSGSGAEDGKSMKITMEVNGILYTGTLYAKPS